MGREPYKRLTRKTKTSLRALLAELREVRQTGRVTMGVRLMNLASGVTVVALARNAESVADSVVVDDGAVDADDEGGSDVVLNDGAADETAEIDNDSDNSADSDNEPGDTDV